MMEAQIKALNGRVTVKVSGEDAKALFKELASAQEIFSAADQCELCQSADLRFNYRTVDSFSFYELKCNACGGALSFGQRKDGSGLFPKPPWGRYEHQEG